MSKNTHSVIYRFYGARKKTMNNIYPIEMYRHISAKTLNGKMKS